jgi:hypothetical protein
MVLKDRCGFQHVASGVILRIPLWACYVIVEAASSFDDQHPQILVTNNIIYEISAGVNTRKGFRAFAHINFMLYIFKAQSRRLHISSCSLF